MTSIININLKELDHQINNYVMRFNTTPYIIISNNTLLIIKEYCKYNHLEEIKDSKYKSSKILFDDTLPIGMFDVR